MGNVLVAMIPAIIGLTGHGISLFFRPREQNPTFEAIQALYLAQHAQKEAEKSAREAHKLFEHIRQQAAWNREEARLRQREADQATAQAARETEMLRAQMEEAVRAANHAKELSEAAGSEAKEEVERLLRDVHEERKRVQRMREDLERAMVAMREEVEKAQRAAETQRRYAEESKALAEELAHTAMEETRKAMRAKEEAERCLKEGIQPIVTPTPDEVSAAKNRIQYDENFFHFAVAGISGSGKSSLVNAFRGLCNKDAGAAEVGVTETTLEITRYADANPQRPFVWYDIPGAGTINCPDWQYFNNKGLYIFDCIIIVFDTRFTMTDIALIMNAKRFNIPTYIVRSKADQHIRNIMVEMGYGSDSEDREDTKSRNELYEAARKQFIEDTRKSIKANLETANLPDPGVYIVCSQTISHIVLNKKPKNMIDEANLVNDLLNQVILTRIVQPNNSALDGEA